MATLVDVLRQLGARPADRRADAHPRTGALVLDGAVLGLDSLFGGPLSGDVAVRSQSSESIVFEEPLELAACGTLWMPDVEDVETFREAVADAHATLGARLETDLRTLAQLGYDAVLDAPRPRAIALYEHAGHTLTVAIGSDGELTLVQVDDTAVSDAEGRALAAPEEVDGPTARAAVERVLARLVDTGAVFAADSLDVDMASHSDEHSGDERRPTSVTARPPQGTVPLSEEEIGELNAALDDEDDSNANPDDEDADERTAHARTAALSAVSQIDVDIVDEEEEEPEPTQAVEAPARRASEEATRAEQEPSVDAGIEARLQGRPSPDASPDAPADAPADEAAHPSPDGPRMAGAREDEGSLADAFDDDDEVGGPTRVPGTPRDQAAPTVDVDDDDEPEPTVTALAPVVSTRQSVEAPAPRGAAPMESSLLDAFDDDAPALTDPPATAASHDDEDEGPRTDSLARPPAVDESRTAAMSLAMLAAAADDDSPSSPPTMPGEMQSPLQAQSARDGVGVMGTADDDALASDPDGASGAAEISDEPQEPSTDGGVRARAPTPSVAVTREVSGFGDVVVDDDGFDGSDEAEGFDDSFDRTRTTTTKDDGAGAAAALPPPADTAAWVAPPLAPSAQPSATMGDDEAGSASSMAPPRAAPPQGAAPPATLTHAVAAIAARTLQRDEEPEVEPSDEPAAAAADPKDQPARADDRDLARDAAGFDDGDDFEEETIAARPDDQKTRAVFVQDALREISTRAAHTVPPAPSSAAEPAPSGAAAVDATSADPAGAEGEDPGELEARAEELEAQARSLRDRAVVIRASRLPQPAAAQESVPASAPPAQPSVEASSLPSLASIDVEAVDDDTAAIGMQKPPAAARALAKPQAKTPPPASEVPVPRPGARLNPEDLFEGVSFAAVQAALREQEARNAQTQLAAPEIGELHEVSDSGDVFGNMEASEPSAPQPPVSVEAPRAVGLVVEDARARDRLKKRLQVRIAELVEASDVHDVSALPSLRDLAAVVFVRPRNDERTLVGLERLASLEERPRILVLSSDSAFDRVGAIDLRVALGERASEVAQQVLDGLLQLGVPLSETTEP
jgi:hypothetical protein